MSIPQLSLEVSKSLDEIVANDVVVQGLQNRLNVHNSLELEGKVSP